MDKEGGDESICKQTSEECVPRVALPVMASTGLKRSRSTYGGSSEEDLPSEDRICPFCAKGHRDGLEVRQR